MAIEARVLRYVSAGLDGPFLILNNEMKLGRAYLSAVALTGFENRVEYSVADPLEFTRATPEASREILPRLNLLTLPIIPDDKININWDLTGVTQPRKIPITGSTQKIFINGLECGSLCEACKRPKPCPDVTANTLRCLGKVEVTA